MKTLRNPIPPQPPSCPAPRLLLRPQEAAGALGISLRGLMNMVDADEIPVVRIGVRNLRFSVDDLRTWIRERSTRRPAADQGGAPPRNRFDDDEALPRCDVQDDRTRGVVPRDHRPGTGAW